MSPGNPQGSACIGEQLRASLPLHGAESLEDFRMNRTSVFPFGVTTALLGLVALAAVPRVASAHGGNNDAAVVHACVQ